MEKLTIVLIDVPDSKTFDVTLMTTLLRNLTPMTPPLCGFDRLPAALETTQSADLARIKYYRNYLAHLDDGKIDTTFLHTAWNDITSAIERLGGQQMKQECDHMKTKPLDQTNLEIMMDIKHSDNEIRQLKESCESLKLSHTEMIKSHELLQKTHAVVTKEMEGIKISQMDSVPWNIRVRIKDTLKTWKDNDNKMFINTRAAQYVLKCIQENSCVTITASSGVGKSSTLRHTALQLAEEEYDVLLVTAPSDILRFYNPNKKILFVIDDLCGNFSVDQSDIKNWEPVMEDIKKILDTKQTKILAACRLQVYQDEKFDSLSVFKACVCNMLSETISLSKTEKCSIAKLYLNAKASEISDYYDLYECFPLLCKLCHDNPKLSVTDFFQNPFSVYEAEIDSLLKKGYYTKYCALALCVMFNNELREELLTEEVNEVIQTIIENTCEACKLDRGTSRLVLRKELDLLSHTFIKKEQNVYKTIHDKIFDFLAFCFGQKIIYCLIKNADNGLIKERFVLENKDDTDQFVIIIPEKYHQIYIQRMIDEWSKGKVQSVFNNINMKIPHFRQKFLTCLNTLNIANQRQLANTFNKHEELRKLGSVRLDYYDTALLNSCYLGDISLIKWCCNHGADVNMCSYNDQSPILIGCVQGHTELVEILLDRGADCNKCDKSGQSPLNVACEHGHKEIVKMLLDRGADCNKCDNLNRSPVMKACTHSHTEILRMLLYKGADCNKCDWRQQPPLLEALEHGCTEIVKMMLDKVDCNKCARLGQSPLLEACEHGHTDIVKMMLDRGANCNYCDRLRQSPLSKACENGHTEIIKMLIDKEADLNKYDIYDTSPLMQACKRGYSEIVKILMEKGADCNEWYENGKSAVIMACNQGHTEIVKLLLDRGADYNVYDKWRQSPLMKVCTQGFTEIVKILLERGADVNTIDCCGDSPVLLACRYGHTEIFKMLLERGADLKKCIENHENNESLLTIPCQNGYTEIVKILLDRGADCNTCDRWGQSPSMKACKYGHTEIVKMLLDKGADLNKLNAKDKSALMKACKHGHTEIVKILLDRGAVVHKCDKLGQSPLMKACEHGHTDIIKMLLDREADCHKCNGEDKLPG